jgi:hypothetical protein
MKRAPKVIQGTEESSYAIKTDFVLLQVIPQGYAQGKQHPGLFHQAAQLNQGSGTGTAAL